MPQCFTLSVRMLSEQAGSVVELSVFQYSNLSCLPSMISSLLVMVREGSVGSGPTAFVFQEGVVISHLLE